MSLTFESQRSLAAYCRTGIYQPIQGVNPQRASHYRRLVYNVIEETLATCYPLTQGLLEKSEWDNLVQNFFSTHQCGNPYIWKMPYELIAYIETNETTLWAKYPFLIDLLNIEWVETQVYMQEDREPLCAYLTDGDINEDALVMNTELELVHCTYPVHLKQAQDIQENDKGNYFVVVHRHPLSGDVFFMDISSILLRLIEVLLETPQTLKIVLAQIEQEFQTVINKETHQNICLFLQEAQQNSLLLGFTKQ